MVCAALANEKWTLERQEEYGENEMLGVWRRDNQFAAFSAIVISVKRPAPSQPYEVTSWSAYARLDGVLQPKMGSD